MAKEDHGPLNLAGETALPRVVVIGNLTMDDVVYPDGTSSMGSIGGNSVYSSIAACIWGVRVGVVARVGEDFPAFALDRLREAGVLTDGLRPIPGATVRNWILYENDGRRTWVYRTPPLRSLEVAPQPADLPTAWIRQAEVPVFHVAAMPLPAAARIVESIRSASSQAIVTLDTHEDWCSDRDALLAVARQVNVFIPSREELETLLGYDDPERACNELIDAGIQAIVVKCGANGAVVATSAGIRAKIAPCDVAVVDTTGAGDSFCGGLVAGLALGDDIVDATRRGTATAGAALGASGSLRLLENRAFLANELFLRYSGAAADTIAVPGDKPDGYGIDVMQREIETIPLVIKTQLSSPEGPVAALAGDLLRSGTRELVFVGCGDSAFVGQAAALAFNRHTAIRARAEHALDFARFGVRYLPKNCAVVTISFSGQVGRTIEAAHQAETFGHRVIALTHETSSPLAKAANEALPIDIPTLGFSPGTSTYIGMLVTLLDLAAHLSGGALPPDGRLRDQLNKLPELAAETLAMCEGPVLVAAQHLLGSRVVTFLGAGPNEASARFGAAKMVEGPQQLAVATNVEEWAHEQYFTTQRGEPVVVVAPTGAASDRAAEIVSELTFVGATTIVVGDQPLSAEVCHLPISANVPEELSPVLAALPLSQLGFHLARLSGKRSYNFPSEEAKKEHYETIHRVSIGEPA
jgi:sugar/nucleoside kinase (ribokinase family)/fructoselysine-6-P-deglycase FrlB-like protein